MTIEDKVAARFENHQNISIGRIVHYVLPKVDALNNQVIRPALVVRVWGLNCVQLQVFYDGSNDDSVRDNNILVGTQLNEWVTSVTYDGGEARQREVNGTPELYTHYNFRTWHWPPRG